MDKGGDESRSRPSSQKEKKSAAPFDEKDLVNPGSLEEKRISAPALQEDEVEKKPRSDVTPTATRDSSPNVLLPEEEKTSTLIHRKLSKRQKKKNAMLDPDELNQPSQSSSRRSSILDHRGRPLHDLQHHEHRPSLLSHHTKQLNLRGFYNLFVIVLLVSNFRMVLENVLKYGFMFTLPSSLDDMLRNWPVLLCFVLLHLCFAWAWFTERYVASWSRKVFDPWMALCIGTNFIMLLLMPFFTVIYSRPEPTSAVFLLSFSIVWLFKLWSFHHVCFDIRRAILLGEDMAEFCWNEKEVEKARKYPECTSLRHFYNYILMPTMCYQLHYPRTSGIRWLSVARHLVESLVCAALMKLIVDQYIVITVKNTFTITELKQIPLSTLLIHFLERMLKLSIPNLYFWLLMFMGLFHHWCNILAELTCFGDRRFYEDWWNASSFGEYWRKWNLPIHHFMNRHMNKPLLRRRCPRFLSGLVVFLISAFLHEYLVVVPLQLGWTGYVFWAFMGQIPLTHISNLNFFQRHKTIGNAFFWCIFCFTGQPLGILLYWYLWGVKEGMVTELDPSRIQMA